MLLYKNMFKKVVFLRRGGHIKKNHVLTLFSCVAVLDNLSPLHNTRSDWSHTCL